MIRSLTAVAALTVLSTCAQAFVLIDDFTVGEHEVTFVEGTDVHSEFGLDRSRVALGERSTVFRAGGNFFQRPVTFRIGDGEARVSTDTQELGTSWLLDYGNSDVNEIDLSAEDEIRIDLYTENPPNRFADGWGVYLRDRNGVTDTNQNWLLRPDGIYFRRQDFDPRLDWSRIEFFRFDQRYSTTFGPHPWVYATTRIYAVPEPSVLLAVAAAGMLARRRMRN